MSQKAIDETAPPSWDHKIYNFGPEYTIGVINGGAIGYHIQDNVDSFVIFICGPDITIANLLLYCADLKRNKLDVIPLIGGKQILQKYPIDDPLLRMAIEQVLGVDLTSPEGEEL